MKYPISFTFWQLTCTQPKISYCLDTEYKCMNCLKHDSPRLVNHHAIYTPCNMIRSWGCTAQVRSPTLSTLSAPKDAMVASAHTYTWPRTSSRSPWVDTLPLPWVLAASNPHNRGLHNPYSATQTRKYSACSSSARAPQQEHSPQ